MYVSQGHVILIIGEGQVIHMTAKGAEKQNILDIAKDISFDKVQRLALILMTIYVFKYDFHIQYMISIFSIRFPYSVYDFLVQRMIFILSI